MGCKSIVLHNRAWLCSLICIGLGTTVLSGCGSPAKQPTTATFASPFVGEPFNYISPFVTGAADTVPNGQIDPLMYRPLYWFGKGASPVVDYQLSLAYPPTFSANGRTVTIRLKHYLWSDGVPVTSRDVEFWMNLMVANKTEYGNYVPGDIPDNISAMSFPNAKTVVFTFNKAYSHTWLLYNQLSEIIPIPQQTWDKVSSTGKVGNYDLTTSGAQAVFKWLNGQSSQLSTYDTNPIWQVVDGPWKIEPNDGYQPTTGLTVLVPNASYSGPFKPKIEKFEEIPFTSDQAEFDALKSGTLDYGFLPIPDLGQKSSLTRAGYTFAPWTAWGINYAPYNFTNPTVGPIFAQLYVRQAIQHLVNQPLIISKVFDGLAYPDYGPVPPQPKSPFLSPSAAVNPYPYSVSAARTLLSSHGWSIVPNGTDACVRPGTSSTECGAGVAGGAKLTFSFQYDSGVPEAAAEAEILKSTMGLVGIDLTLTEAPHSEIYGTFETCSSSAPGSCSWGVKYWSPGTHAWTFAPDYEPTGGVNFEPGGGNNRGGYNNPTVTRLIDETHTSSSYGVFYAYEIAVAKDLPVIWLPEEYSSLSEISTRLRGAVPQDPFLDIEPEQWSFAR